MKTKSLAELKAKMEARRLKKLDLLAHVKPTGDLQGDCQQELSETLKAVKDKKVQEAARVDKALDTEHWVALSFATREQKEAFLKLSGWAHLGDKFLRGKDVAQEMGLDLPPEDMPVPKQRMGDVLRSMPAIRKL